MKRRFGLMAGGALAVFVAGMLIFAKKPERAKAPILSENFVNLKTVEKISKFRSCQGHVVIPVDGKEARSNMKHYFYLKPGYRYSKKVKLFAPYAGKISTIRSEAKKGLEGEIWLSNGSDWEFSIEHILVLESLKKGDRVDAGQLLGFAAGDDFDVIYAKGALIPRKIDGWNSPFAALDSVFNHMDDKLMAEYQSKGIDNPGEVIYERDYRKTRPCRYRDDKGGFEGGDLSEDWVYLK